VRLRGLIVVCSLVAFSFCGGCAAIFQGTSQTVAIKTIPEQKTFQYNGVVQKADSSITILKHFDAPSIYAGEKYETKIDVPSSVSLWLIGDGVLCLFFIIPGLIGFGVDFGTGAFRIYDMPTVITVPATTPDAK